MLVARERIVRSLQGLYTVVAGLALTKSIERLFEGSTSSQVEFHAHHLPGLVAFIATLIPFYHGALRHLDRRYIEEHGAGLKDGALAADFALLFVEGCFLAAMAYLVATPSKLMNAGVLLLGIARLDGNVLEAEIDVVLLHEVERVGDEAVAFDVGVELLPERVLVEEGVVLLFVALFGERIFGAQFERDGR